MSPYQSSTLALIGSLSLVSLWRAGHIQGIWTVATTNQGGSLADAGPIGTDLLGVAVIVFLAGLSPDLGKMMIALSAGLWLLYLMSGPAPHQAGASLGTKIQGVFR